MDDTWMTKAEALSALGIGSSTLSTLVRRGRLERTFDRPDSAGSPRYRRSAVEKLARERSATHGPTWWTADQAAEHLGLSVRGFYKLLEREDGIALSTVGPPRYGAESVRAVAKRRVAAPGRFLTPEQAAARLGVSAVQFRVIAAQHDGLGFNSRTGRYPTSRVDAAR